MLKGRAFLAEQRNEEALENYGRLFELVPGSPVLFENLKTITEQFKKYCLLFGNVEDANRVFSQIEEIYKKILKEEPGNMIVSDHLLFLYEVSGDLYSKLGSIEKTEENYLRDLDFLKEKLRIQPGNISYILKQGEIYQSLGMAFYNNGKAERHCVSSGRRI
ncbi:TPR-domain containing protein [Methanosarcina siciliae T4/M]|uniref:TPR-domain containing protein n=1 Tax=Methanosarcina siciliae T4/M TaxID=1434120 RepID=A0A0E3L8M2_9EURY|nr:hypothetical protein [Methanosarcina siciliae]AKB28766.1 TPR-domain containing protein [Methanosarcina siciliae T4/M]